MLGTDRCQQLHPFLLLYLPERDNLWGSHSFITLESKLAAYLQLMVLHCSCCPDLSNKFVI